MMFEAKEARNSKLAGVPTELKATPFVYKDPMQIPPRQWLYGRHLIRKNLSVTVAPGGVGKSSLTIIQALELASGRKLLGHWNGGPLKVWLFNLEDERSELDRRLSAAMMHYDISDEDLAGRLYVDTGREQELVLATQERDEALLNTALIESLAQEIAERRIDVMIVDPFVSSHRVNEMDNGKIDFVSKTWIRLAEYSNCAIELVHHTRKLNGAAASSESSRGASSLINAARSARVLQRLSEKELSDVGVVSNGSTYFSVRRDKSNLASSGEREIYRTVTVDLGQGDQVGVVEWWEKPDLFRGIKPADTLEVQKAIDGKGLRHSDQATDWCGHTIAQVLSLETVKDKGRIKKLIEAWIASGVLAKKYIKDTKGKEVPVVEVGEWMNA
ncbi:MAG: AAA family ATPase [Sulfitobacter sp.]|nr:AAA family ATPase [Sulfitobacter sp.]